MGDPIKIRLNGEVVDLIPVRAAHTAGDTMIRFENADVIMIGDFYRNYGYPFIDTNNVGTLKGALGAFDETMKLAGPNTRLIPGHGAIIHRTDIVPYRDMILDVQAEVRQLIGQGKQSKKSWPRKSRLPMMRRFPVDCCLPAREPAPTVSSAWCIRTSRPGNCTRPTFDRSSSVVKSAELSLRNCHAPGSFY